MPDKKPDPKAEVKDNPVNPGRPQDASDDPQAPKNYLPSGDAVPITDPLLSPAAQQPGESGEDFEKRRPKPTA